jgi:hypothetical protein
MSQVSPSFKKKEEEFFLISIWKIDYYIVISIVNIINIVKIVIITQDLSVTTLIVASLFTQTQSKIHHFVLKFTLQMMEYHLLL